MTLIFFIGFFLMVGIILIVITTKQNKKIPEENGKTPLYEESFCSGSINRMQYRGAMRIAIYKEFFAISTLFDKVVLHWNEITSVELKPYFLLQKGLFIQHTKKELAGDIIIVSNDNEKILKVIQKQIVKN